MYLTEMKLDDLKPHPKLNKADTETLLASLGYEADEIEVSSSGLATPKVGVDWADFIKCGRFYVRFGDYKLPGKCVLNNVYSLEGMPRTMPNSALDIRSSSLLSLEGCTAEAANVFVYATNLTSLKGMPKKTNLFHLNTDHLTSLRELTGEHKSLDLCGCSAVTNTDGLKGFKADYIGFPIDSLAEITDIPEHANSIGVKLSVYNAPKLMLIKGLDSIIRKVSQSGTPKEVKTGRDVHEILSLVLRQHKSPKDRYFVAQNALIDAGYDHLV